MRVLYYTRPAFLDAGLHLIDQLSRRVEVHVLLEISPEARRSSLFDAPAERLPPGITPAEPLLRACLPPGVAAYWSRVASFNLVVHTQPKSLHPATWATALQSLRFMCRLRPDVVHFDDVSLRVATALPLARLPPVVLSIHDPEPHSGEANWRRDLGRWLAFRKASRFILFNHALEQWFTTTYSIPAARVDVTRLGVYDVYRAWDPPEKPRELPHSVLFFGRLSPYKGLDVLYAAASQLAVSVPNLRVIVAGQPTAGYRPPEPPRLANGGLVEVIGSYIPNQQLAELFRQSSVVCCPYTDATQSGVILTAFAFDRPVVATSVGGIPEYVQPGETGLLAPPNDPAAIADALRRVLTDPSVRQRLQEGARNARNGYLSWGHAGDQILETYRRASQDGVTTG